VLLALRNTAKYLKDGKVVEIPGPELMKSAKPYFSGYPAFAFVGYPNRDSTPYSKRYNIPEAGTVLRGTLRYGGFPTFVQALVNLGLLDTQEVDHLKSGAAEVTWRALICTLLGVAASASDADLTKALSDKAKLSVLSDDERQNILFGFKWLGLFSNEAKVLINYRLIIIITAQVQLRGSLLDCLCATLEEKMAYQKGERDMVMLQHRFGVETATGQKQTRLSTLLAFGEPDGTTAMARTVGVPCGIAVQLVLDGVISERGVIAPMSMSICAPLMDALAKEGITMDEEIIA
jgi:saccharopine dehydrogenase (NADP+, L-glutamate forming)